MKEVACKKCKFLNDPNATYCQHCGALLGKCKSLKTVVESFNFDTVAGLGQKGISIAPLVGMKKGSNQDSNNSKIVGKSYSLEDGSWYCPYCGDKNRSNNYECCNCLKAKP